MEQMTKHVRTRQTPIACLKQAKPARPTLSRHVKQDPSSGNTHNSIQVSIEKFTTLAREAMASGDRILAESFYQQAEHYLRLYKERKDVAIPRKNRRMSIKTHAVPGDFEMSIEQELVMAQSRTEDHELTKISP